MKNLLKSRAEYSGPMITNPDVGFGGDIARFADKGRLQPPSVRGVPNRIEDNIFDRTVEQLRWAAYGAAFVRRVKIYATSAVTSFENRYRRPLGAETYSVGVLSTLG